MFILVVGYMKILFSAGPDTESHLPQENPFGKNICPFWETRELGVSFYKKKNIAKE